MSDRLPTPVLPQCRTFDRDGKSICEEPARYIVWGHLYDKAEKGPKCWRHLTQKAKGIMFGSPAVFDLQEFLNSSAPDTRVPLTLHVQYEKGGHLLVASSDRNLLSIDDGDTVVTQTVMIEAPGDRPARTVRETIHRCLSYHFDICYGHEPGEDPECQSMADAVIPLLKGGATPAFEPLRVAIHDSIERCNHGFYSGGISAGEGYRACQFVAGAILDQITAEGGIDVH